MKTSYFIKTIVLFLILSCGVSLDASAKKEKSRLRVYYEKLSDNDKKVSVILIKGKGKNMVGIEKAEVFLSTFRGEEEVPLTSIITDVNGEAALYIQADYLFPTNDEGYVVINAVYNGNDSVKASDKDIDFKDLHIDVSLDIVDSVKLITVTAYELDLTGQKTPIEEIGLKIGVDRLHSALYLEEIETDEDGIAEMHFPNDIPGDGTGKINVIVKVDDDKVYGTITKSIESDWGLVVDYSEHSNGRSLYGDEAPLWMTISVLVILLGAWFHFLFAIYRVYKMSSTNKNLV